MQITQEVIDKLKIIEAGKITYLGFLGENDGDGVTIFSAIQIAQGYQGFDEGIIAFWLKAMNLDETTEVTLRGNKGYQTREIPKDMKVSFAELFTLWTKVTEYAMQYWQNEVFDKHYRNR